MFSPPYYVEFYMEYYGGVCDFSLRRYHLQPGDIGWKPVSLMFPHDKKRLHPNVGELCIKNDFVVVLMSK